MAIENEHWIEYVVTECTWKVASEGIGMESCFAPRGRLCECVTCTVMPRRLVDILFDRFVVRGEEEQMRCVVNVKREMAVCMEARGWTCDVYRGFKLVRGDRVGAFG